MEPYIPEPPPLSRPISSLHRSFFRGSFFTASPEEIPTEKAKPKGQNPDEKEGTEYFEVRVQSTSEVVKGGANRDEPTYLGSVTVEKDVTEVEVVEAVILDGSLPAGEDKVREVDTVDKKSKPETTEKTGTGDDAARPPREAKSLRSLDSKKSTKDGARSFKKPWSLIPKRSSSQIPVPTSGGNLTEDVAGPRFGAPNGPEMGRCAGDYPPIYKEEFVSSTSFSHRYLSRYRLPLRKRRTLFGRESRSEG
jgi:hypothetical protein